MRKINIENYETKFPYLNYEFFNNLENKEEYLNEYSAYVELLVKYLIKNTSIKEMDDKIKNSKEFICPFEGVEKDNQDLYQYLCSDYLTFFYIRNNIYIERLTDEEKKQLNSIINSNNQEFDESQELFVKNTFSKLIKEEIGSNKNNLVNFGPGNKSEYYALTDSLVIGARYDEGVPVEAFNQNKHLYFERQDYFEEECESLNKKLKDELKQEVSVIRYNNDSIKTIKIENDIVLK